ncbi:MAG: flavodoxin-dependent (E)-4-hydroxy-3-methylbut-2-enyl-diphosphate synthase [Clostridia bacterium]|nr:flavodoxin-dependent (E)-4-hydroxy-3-methylbut-2-enyl-diphosphate synthase [Clostridia bacterium]
MKETFSKRDCRRVTAGPLAIGGGAPVSVQSMTNTDPHDFAACLRQVQALAEAGCDLVRLTVPDEAAAGVFPYLRGAGLTVPLCADIHFDHKLALAAVAAGADKIRLNPGNIGGRDRVRAVAEACGERGIPIRIGVNAGSLERHLLEKHGAPTAEALCESALYHASLLEDCGFYDVVLSVKASSVPTMIAANRLLAERTSYPLHLGVTEAGDEHAGTVKSAVGIGTLLAEGIGDTVRVSLTADPVREVAAAREILDSLSLSSRPRLSIVSCPTCGRTGIDLCALSAEFRRAAEREGLLSLPLTVALMGCVVNGPGEAREADLGIAGGRGEAVLFEKGDVVAKLPEEGIVAALIDRLKALRSEHS